MTVVLGGGYSAAEQTLFEAGKWYEVRQARLSWQDSMQAKFVDAIEELSGPRADQDLEQLAHLPPLGVTSGRRGAP